LERLELTVALNQPFMVSLVCPEVARRSEPLNGLNDLNVDGITLEL
jgi:hypothetical protein